MKAVVRQIVSLASGTLAGLFGNPRYDYLDAEQYKWMQWVEASSEEFEIWQDAWAAYDKVRGEL